MKNMKMHILTENNAGKTEIKYNENEKLVAQSDGRFDRFYGDENGVFWMLAPISTGKKNPVPEGIVKIALDLSTTGVTMGVLEPGVQEPKIIDRSRQNELLTPVKEENAKDTLKEFMWDDRYASGYTTPAVARINEPDTDGLIRHKATHILCTTILDRELLRERTMQDSLGNNIIVSPKQRIGSLSRRSEEYNKNKKALAGLAAEALIRAVRSYPDKKNSDFMFLCSYAATNESHSKEAILEAIRIANETLGINFLKVDTNVTLVPEHIAAKQYYHRTLPDGTIAGENLITIDIGSYSTDVSITLGGQLVDCFSIPYAGHIITEDTWKELCIYDIDEAMSIFDLNDSAKARELVRELKNYIGRKYGGGADNPLDRKDIINSNILDVGFELLSKYINKNRIDARRFTLFSRIKASALLWLIEEELYRCLMQSGDIDEHIDMVFLGRGSYVFRNLSNGNSELLSGWEKRLEEKTNKEVSVQIAESTEKVQLIHGMLDFPVRDNRPDIPDDVAIQKKNCYEHYKESLGTQEAEELYKRIENGLEDARKCEEVDDARNRLRTNMYKKILKDYTYDRFCEDLQNKSYIPEGGDGDSFISRNRESVNVLGEMMNPNWFRTAKNNIDNEGEECERFVMAATGIEEDLYFLKLVEKIILFILTRREEENGGNA